MKCRNLAGKNTKRLKENFLLELYTLKNEMQSKLTLKTKKINFFHLLILT